MFLMINQWIWSVRNFWTNAHGPGQLHGKYPLIDSPVIVDLLEKKTLAPELNQVSAMTPEKHWLQKKMIENH